MVKTASEILKAALCKVFANSESNVAEDKPEENQDRMDDCSLYQDTDEWDEPEMVLLSEEIFRFRPN